MEERNVRFETPSDVVGVLLLFHSGVEATALNLVNDFARVCFGFLGCVCNQRISKMLLGWKKEKDREESDGQARAYLGC